jgi:hypothetical protein
MQSIAAVIASLVRFLAMPEFALPTTLALAIYTVYYRELV